MANHQQYVMGVDCGATKVNITLATTQGVILGTGVGPGCNFHNNPLDLKTNLKIALAKAIRNTKQDFNIQISQIEVCCLGLAGLDTPADFDRCAQVVSTNTFRKALKMGSEGKIIVVNDAFIALSFGSYSGYGICSVAGTGSNCLGVNKKGEIATAGNWGYLVGDQGSGFTLGQSILKRVFEEYDGRAPLTPLTQAILAQYQMKSIDKLYELIYKSPNHVSLIAQAVQVIHQETVYTLPLIKPFLNHFITAHIKSFLTVFHHLHFNSAQELDVVLSGGLFKNIPSLSRQFSLEIMRITPAANIKILQSNPVLGAAEIAQKYAAQKPLILPTNVQIH